MFRRNKLIAAVCALGASVATVPAAGLAADGGQAGQGGRSPELVLVDRPAERFQQSIETHSLRTRYRDLLQRAERLGVAPDEHLLDRREAPAHRLREGIAELRSKLKQARARLGAAHEAGGEAEGHAPAGAVTGVSSGTLEAIAACESGGDPGAVNPAGYYGKYQFDLGTWQSVGGSGSPAAASEAEQDYRASLLYQRAGASPWPVCGS